jgi:hypothetical protein
MPTNQPCANSSELIDSPLEQLKQQLATLDQSRLENFDPIRFHFIHSMLQKAQHQLEIKPSTNNTEAAQLIADKALLALNKLQANFDSAQSTAADTLKSIQEQFPEAVSSANLMFEGGKFKTLDQLIKELTHQAKERSPKQDSLKSLNESLTAQSNQNSNKMIGSDFDHYLQKQNDEIRQRLISEQKTPPLAETITDTQTSTKLEIKELRSSQRLRHKKEKQSTEKAINKAITESPEGAGPLNPQRLALRALTSMQKLSPAYVNRLVAYIDSLLWLEQAANKASKSTSKKSTRRK